MPQTVAAATGAQFCCFYCYCCCCCCACFCFYAVGCAFMLFSISSFVATLAKPSLGSGTGPPRLAQALCISICACFSLCTCVCVWCVCSFLLLQQQQHVAAFVFWGQAAVSPPNSSNAGAAALFAIPSSGLLMQPLSACCTCLELS